ncbi:MAG: tyrosine-type recombinase/integrase, partial [Planctomycetota bacterium]
KYVDEAGRYADFHALRHTCGTLLAAAGVHPKTAQEIMRHSDIRLTMDYYTHFMTGQEHKAVESLPNLGGQIDSKRTTGTDG